MFTFPPRKLAEAGWPLITLIALTLITSIGTHGFELTDRLLALVRLLEVTVSVPMPHVLYFMPTKSNTPFVNVAVAGFRTAPAAALKT